MAVPAKSRRIEIRVTDEEHAVEEAAAQTLGVTLSEFYRQAARARAEEILAERSRVVLDDDELSGSSTRWIIRSASRRVCASSPSARACFRRERLVHAIDHDAVRFYRRYGFQPATADGRTLMVPLAAARTQLTGRRNPSTR